MSEASMLKSYCLFAFAAAIYLINRMPTPNLDFQSPYERLFQKAPNYKRCCVFGCCCYPWLQPYMKHKLDDRSKPCVFWGIPLVTVGTCVSRYQFRDCIHHTMLCSRKQSSLSLQISFLKLQLHISKSLTPTQFSTRHLQQHS